MLVPVTEESAAAVVAGEDSVLAVGPEVFNGLIGEAVTATISRALLYPVLDAFAPAAGD